MSDPFSRWSLALGRWSGTRVRVHLMLALFVALSVLGAAIDPETSLKQTLAWQGLFLMALVLHELGHAAQARWLGEEPDDVDLAPFGNLTLPSPADALRPREAVQIALAGPMVNAALALCCGVALHLVGARMVLNPFGNPAESKLGSGVPWVGDQAAQVFSAIWYIGWFGWLNLVLAVVNLIPAAPLDGGRALRAFLAGSTSTTRDSMAALYVARASAVLLFVLFLLRLFQGKTGAIPLLFLAIFIEIIVRFEARMMEEGGYYEEGGLFGYDFSEGYTSLEAGAKVRPRRESALRRWRRRRSELRRQRRLAKDAAEEQRMDEILDKLHRDGRGSLTDEEHRFLIRVSKRIKNKDRSRGA
jgi:Zn-dependent protease